MKYYCENCRHMSDFGDFCLDCESPNMIPVYQSKKNPKAGNCRGIANRNNNQSFEQNDRRLAKNVAANQGDNPKKTKFTPGPWRVHLDKRNGTACAIIEDRTGDCVARTTVCRFHRGERNANGNLISAAPDMYEALDEALDFIIYLFFRVQITTKECEDTADAIMTKGCAALRKARGEK